MHSDAFGREIENSRHASASVFAKGGLHCCVGSGKKSSLKFSEVVIQKQEMPSIVLIKDKNDSFMALY